MPDLRRVHRFRDHAIAGVNWRPTHFADEVPSSRVCGLCRMIPKRTVLLPCSHVLCESCHAANTQGCGGRCPLDQEPFDEAECGSYEFPARKANALKVYCWNEAHGCEYKGATEDMLRHFENECTFHSVECLRCGEGVLHSELATHYVTGCSTRVSSARAENPPSESRALTLQDVRDALEEVKTLLREPNHEHALSAIQSQMNELKEQVRSRESRLAETTREAGATANAETVRYAATASSTAFQEPTTRRSPGDEASTSSSGLCWQEGINQTPEIFSNLSLRVLKQMQKTSTQDYPQHAIESSRESECRGHLRLTSELSTTRTWREVLGSVKYVFTVLNSESRGWELFGNSFAITVLHTMDSCFTIGVGNVFSPGERHLSVEIDFFGILAGSQLSAPRFSVLMTNESGELQCPLHPSEKPCCCNDVGNSRLCWHGAFQRWHEWRVAGLLSTKNVELQIKLERDS